MVFYFIRILTWMNNSSDDNIGPDEKVSIDFVRLLSLVLHKFSAIIPVLCVAFQT